MASPRVPLNELPNVANSRFHAIATAAQKRPRPTSELKHEILYTREPSAKRQLVDPRGSRVNSPAKRANVKVFEDPNTQGAAQPVRGQQSSHDSVARHTQIQQTNPQAQQQTEQGVQQQNPHPDRLSITEWQNHYLRLFPRFTFYFDGVPEDQRALIVRRMLRLGAVSQIP